MLKSDSRTESYKKNKEVERILNELNILLEPLQKNILNNYEYTQNQPIVFIVGNARCGTTLLIQYLSDSGIFCYPSNLISRFYYAPYIGSLVHKLMIDLDTRQELFGLTDQVYQSDLGKTKYAHSPNEFWYFWRRHFPFKDIPKLSSEQLESVDTASFIKELRSIQKVFDKPLLLKANIMNWNIDYLSKSIPNSYFLFISREVAFNAQSLLLARRKFYGTDENWFSFKPPEYPLIKQFKPIQQVCEQVKVTNASIHNDLSKLYSSRFMEIDYNDLCKSPWEIIRQVGNMIDVKIEPIDKIPFKNNNTIKVSNEEWKELVKYSD